MIKVVGYPGERERTRHKYKQMTYAELKSKRSKVADQVLKYKKKCKEAMREGRKIHESLGTKTLDSQVHSVKGDNGP